MIQKLNGRHGSTAMAPYRQSTSSASDSPESWGMWINRRFYSLEVVQQPIRARMCGFGDKDRRPLAPATVAKLVVKNDDDSLVDDDDIDCSFFLVTADLWSSDGAAERNLVLHPTSSDRYITTHAPKKRRPNNHASAPQPPGDTLPHSSTTTSPGPSRYTHTSAGGHQTGPAVALAPGYPTGYPYPHTEQPRESDSVTLHPAPSYNAIPETPDWAYGMQTTGSSSYDAADRALSSTMATLMPSSSSAHEAPLPSQPWHTAGTSAAEDAGAGAFRAWGVHASAYSTLDGELASTSGAAFDGASLGVPQYGSIELREGHAWAQTQPGSPAPAYAPAVSLQEATPASMVAGPQNPPYGESMYASYGQRRPRAPPTPASASTRIPPLPGHAYTRTLVGPLSANACRLLDEHRKPGVFFLFQDLSIRTEGSFRLRLRLMNVGAPPAPEPGATHVHTDVSPVLAQTFTEPFDVYSAKRFPGVPDTTALSIAFGNQGQKLPLRNRHGTSKQGRRRKRGDSDGSDEDSDGA